MDILLTLFHIAIYVVGFGIGCALYFALVGNPFVDNDAEVDTKKSTGSTRR